MILDRGIASFARQPVQKAGEMPTAGGKGPEYLRAWYGEKTVGANRYYTARQYNDRTDKLIRILRPPDEIAIQPNDIAELANGERYRVLQVQYARDGEAGEEIADISLERIGGFDDGTKNM